MKTNMFYLHVLLLYQGSVWTTPKLIQFLPLEVLQVLIWCMNPDVRYSLTNELGCIHLKHRFPVGHLQRIFATQIEISLQYQIQGFPNLGVRNNFFIRSQQVTHPKVIPHCPCECFHRLCREQERNQPMMWLEYAHPATGDLAGVV
jgi:hypothetical protein